MCSRNIAAAQMRAEHACAQLTFAASSKYWATPPDNRLKAAEHRAAGRFIVPGICTWHKGNMTAHRASLTPNQYSTVKFELSAGGRPVAKLCPGAATALKVTFSAPRYGLLTSTVGTFAEGDPWDCANRWVGGCRQPLVAVEWRSAGCCITLWLTTIHQSRPVWT